MLNGYADILKNEGISACNAGELTDLRNVTVNTEKSLAERAREYIVQIHNPYLFKVGETVVRIEFCGGGDFAQLLSDAVVSG